MPGTRSAARVEQNTGAADLTLMVVHLARVKKILPTGGFSARFLGGMTARWE